MASRRGSVLKGKKNRSASNRQAKEWTKGEVISIKERNTESCNNIMKELNSIKRRIDRVLIDFQDFCDTDSYSDDNYHVSNLVDSTYIDELMEKYDRTQREREMILQSLKTFFKKQIFHLKDVSTANTSNSLQRDDKGQTEQDEEDVYQSFKEAWQVALADFERLRLINRQLVELGKEMKSLQKETKKEPSLMGKEQLDHLRDIYTKEAIQNLKMTRQLQEISQEVEKLKQENKDLQEQKNDTRNLQVLLAKAKSEIRHLQGEVKSVKDEQRLASINSNNEQVEIKTKVEQENGEDSASKRKENDLQEQSELPIAPSTPPHDFLSASSIKHLNKRLYSKADITQDVNAIGDRKLSTKSTTINSELLLSKMAVVDKGIAPPPPPPPSPLENEDVTFDPVVTVTTTSVSKPPKSGKVLTNAVVERTLMSQQKMIERKKQSRVQVKTNVKTVELYQALPPANKNPFPALPPHTSPTDTRNDTVPPLYTSGYKPTSERYFSGRALRGRRDSSYRRDSSAVQRRDSSYRKESIIQRNDSLMPKDQHTLQDSFTYKAIPIETQYIYSTIPQTTNNSSYLPLLRKQRLGLLTGQTLHDTDPLNIQGCVLSVHTPNNPKWASSTRPLMKYSRKSSRTYVYSQACDPAVASTKNRQTRAMSMCVLQFPDLF